MMASSNNRTAIVLELLSHGVDVNSHENVSLYVHACTCITADSIHIITDSNVQI